MSLTDSRFSSGVVLRTFSTCSFQLLATMQATGAEREGRSVTAGSSSARPPGRRARVKATSLALRERRGVEALEELEVLGVGGGEARFDVVDPQRVELAGYAGLVLGGQAHALALGPVA